jgi:hypothetical protein
VRGLALRRFLVAGVAPAFTALGNRWRSAVVVAGLGALAAGILIPARSLAVAGSDRRPAISLPEIPTAGPAAASKSYSFASLRLGPFGRTARASRHALLPDARRRG